MGYRRDRAGGVDYMRDRAGEWTTGGTEQGSVLHEGQIRALIYNELMTLHGGEGDSLNSPSIMVERQSELI